MNDFLQIVQFIQAARYRALSAINSDLVNLYWQVGQYISTRLEKASWGDGTVAELAEYIKKHHPEIKGFDKKNLYRMCRFYQTYNDMRFVAPLVRQIQETGNEAVTIVAPLEPQLRETSSGLNGLSDIRETMLAQISWSHHLIIMGRCKTPEEIEFYIRLCIREHYSKRELDRQINSSAFERVMIGNAKLPELKRITIKRITRIPSTRDELYELERHCERREAIRIDEQIASSLAMTGAGSERHPELVSGSPQIGGGAETSSA